MLTLRERFIYLKDHWFVKNVATLQVGTFLSNFLQAVAGVVVARLLQPQLFGIYVLAFGLASLASILLGSGVQDAIASLLGSARTRGDRDEVTEAFGFLIKIAFFTGVISALVAFALPSIAHKIYGNSQIGFYAGIVVFASIISNFFFSFSQIALQISGKIKSLTALIVSDVIIRFSLSILFILAGFGIAGAALGHLLGAGVMLIVSVIVWEWAGRKDNILPSIRTLIKQTREIGIKKYLGFSFWVAVDRNIGNLYMALPVVLVGVYLLAAQVTYFKLAFGFVNLALSLLGPISVLLNVEFPKMQLTEKERMRKNFIKVSLYSLGLSLLLTLGAIIISPIAFKILYGTSFLPSVKYVSGLIVYGGLFGIGVGLGPMWRAINKVKVSILINLIVLGLGIPLGLLMVKVWGVWGAVLMVTAWYTIAHFVSFFYLLGALRDAKN